MCGIAGILDKTEHSGWSDKYNPLGVLERFNHHMQRRGPDSTGLYIGENIFLTMNRLSIVGGQTGQQPIWNEEKTICVVCNGEIYNYRKLRETLESSGHSFTTASDVEVIVHLYEVYGERCLEHVEGIFAFSLWDSRSETLLLARDRCGVKPLYYIDSPDVFMFASEFRALVAENGVNSLNAKSLLRYHTFRFSPFGETIVDGIRKVQPGQYLLIRRARVEKKRYWLPNDVASKRLVGFSTQAKKALLRETLIEAVRSQSTRDVKTGILLSGGFDSTALLAAYKRVTGQAPDTFTVEFERPREFAAETEFCETRYASAVAKQFGAYHEYGCYSASDVLAELPNIITALDEPIADPTAIPLWFAVKQAANSHVKVLYSGEGLDEIFSGYDVYRQVNWIRALRLLPKGFRSIAASFLKAQNLPGHGVIERSLRPLHEWYQGVGGVFSAAELNNLFASNQHIAFKPLQVDCPPLDGGSVLRQMTQFDLSTWLPEDTLVKSDKISMYQSIELRVPFLHGPLVDLALAMDDRDKLRGRTGKWLVRKALYDMVPTAVLNRKKAGFPVPITAWLFGEWKTFAMSTLLDPNAHTRPFYRPSYVEGLFSVPMPQRHRASRLIWTLLSLELWMKHVYIPNTIAGEYRAQRTVRASNSM